MVIAKQFLSFCWCLVVHVSPNFEVEEEEDDAEENMES